MIKNDSILDRVKLDTCLSVCVKMQIWFDHDSSMIMWESFDQDVVAWLLKYVCYKVCVLQIVTNNQMETHFSHQNNHTWKIVQNE